VNSGIVLHAFVDAKQDIKEKMSHGKAQCLSPSI